MKKFILAALTLGFATLGCGRGTVEINGSRYEPRIVIDGVLVPGKPATDIVLTRNVPLNTQVALDQLFLASAQAVISDTKGNSYTLVFNSGTYFHEAQGLSVSYGETYNLSVQAEIDGKVLSAWATTTIPDSGFAVDLAGSQLDTLRYRQRNASGAMKRFSVAFSRSTGHKFYALSITALDAKKETYIFDNAFFDYTPDDFPYDLDDLPFGFSWIQDAPPQAGLSELEAFWFHLNFYSTYRAVVYAGDRNFRDFFLTREKVQEIDGNFIEPILHIQGDGIGVFGSAIADTVYFTVKR